MAQLVACWLAVPEIRFQTLPGANYFIKFHYENAHCTEVEGGPLLKGDRFKGPSGGVRGDALTCRGTQNVFNFFLISC